MNMSCCEKVVDGLATFNTYNFWPASKTHALLDKVAAGEKSKWEYLWIMPVNLGASLIGIALAPIMILIDLISAAIFKLYSCFKCDHGDETAADFMVLAGLQIDMVLIAVGRIFAPNCETNRPVGRWVAACNGLELPA